MTEYTTGPEVYATDGSGHHTHVVTVPAAAPPAPVPPAPAVIPNLPALQAIGTGTQGQAWAAAILSALGAPQTQANLNSMLGWFAMEDNHAKTFGQAADGAGQNNPLNVTADSFAAMPPGVTGSEPSGAGPGHPGNLNFDTPAHGIAAAVEVVKSYAAIYSALRSGAGLIGNPAVAANLSTWSGGGYSSILWPV